MRMRSKENNRSAHQLNRSVQVVDQARSCRRANCNPSYGAVAIEYWVLCMVGEVGIEIEEAGSAPARSAQIQIRVARLRIVLEEVHEDLDVE